MMKVLNIVVDKIPNNCLMCDYYIVSNELDKRDGCEWSCTAGRFGSRAGQYKGLRQILHGRPDWCPLILENEE